jgi:hypothetical protein
MNSEFELLGRQMQLAAGVMLLLYLAAVALLLPREMRFLRSAEPPYRQRFIFLDILLQACILLVLVPCLVSSRLNRMTLTLILSGFSGLWLVVLSLAYLRYVYTYRILVMANLEQLKQAQQALEDRTQRLEQHQDKSGDAQEGGQ